MIGTTSCFCVIMLMLIMNLIALMADENIPNYWQNHMVAWIGPRENAPAVVCDMENPTALYIVATKSLNLCYAYGGQPG